MVMLSGGVLLLQGLIGRSGERSLPTVCGGPGGIVRDSTVITTGIIVDMRCGGGC